MGKRATGVWIFSLIAATLMWVSPAAAVGSPAVSPSLSLHASPAQVMGGKPVTLSGTVTGAPVGGVVRLLKSPYPFTTAQTVRTWVLGVSGRFSFIVFPDRNARYTAVLAGTTAQATVTIGVRALTVGGARALTLGRAKVTIVVFHPHDLHWAGVRVSWSFASGSHGRFIAAPSTRAYKLNPSVAVLGTTIALPAGPFRWRVCFHAPGDQALLDPGRPPGCSGRGYHGSGSLPVGFPGPGAIARAERYLASRGGRTGLAVIDSEGRLSGVNLHEQFITGSVVKAMLLVAYLRRLHAMGQHYIDSYSGSILYPMINVSDNNAATQCWSIVGNSGLYSVAAAAGMTGFSVTTDWGSALLTPADQARFFFEMDSLIPQEFVGYARYLLSTIAGYESWGIPAVARPLGYAVFFKGGWRPSPDVYLVNQIARLEGHHRTFSMAVMTDGDPDMGYGIDTIQGVTSALLG